MRSYNKTTPLCPFLRNSFLAVLALTTSLSQAATLWTGPNIGFFHQQGGPPDPIIPAVALSRLAGGLLFNTAAGETFSNGSSSPTDTMWAFGTLANYSNLTYVTFPSFRNGDTAANILNKPMVLHLTNEDIYIAVTFTNWTQHGIQTGVGSFGYTRSTAPAVTPPSVLLSSPQISNGQFIFSYNATPGSNYVVQSSSTLSNWISLSTNTAAGSTVSVTNPVGPGASYYRVGQQP